MKISKPLLPTSDPWPPTPDPRPAATIPSPPASHLPPSTPRASREAAFSLTEVVIALGIFAVSMVGILALFPVASATGRESSEETQAAILAQTVLSDLQDAASLRAYTNTLVIRGPDTVKTGSWLRLNLSTTSINFIGYDISVRVGDPLEGVGMQGDPLALKASSTILTSDDYKTGRSDMAYLARIEVSTNTGVPQLSQVTVRVEAPGNLPATNRRAYQFSTLVTGR